MTAYSITIVFSTDRPLTPEEQDQISMAVAVQVEDPLDEEGDSLDVDVSVMSVDWEQA